MKARTSAKILVDALLQYTAQAGLDEKEQNNYFRYAYQLAQLKNRNAMLNPILRISMFCTLAGKASNNIKNIFNK